MSRGLKVNQVKNKLIHFTRPTRGRHAGDGPTITIPINTPGQTKQKKAGKLNQYVGVGLNSHLKFNKHVQKTTSKALATTHALCLLGNSIQGIHQNQVRQIYIGAICPMATYSLPIFWKSKNGKILNTLMAM